MSKKAQQANFEQALEILRASGFETAPYASVPGGVLASREGVGAVLVAGEEVARIAVGAGRMIGGELSRLVDRGYQKFLKTSRFELPARASDLHAIHAFDEELKGFTAGIGVQAVDRKSNVDPWRFEQKTPGYALFNLRLGYQREHLRMNVASENQLNRNYELPLGGVNFDDFMASMWMDQIRPLTGRGRSVSGSLAIRF